MNSKDLLNRHSKIDILNAVKRLGIESLFGVGYIDNINEIPEYLEMLKSYEIAEIDKAI